MTELPQTIFGQMKFLLTEFGDFYLQGIMFTLIIALVGTFLGTIIGCFLALIRNVETTSNDNVIIKILKKLLVGLVSLYIDVVRGTPMMVQAMLFYFGFASNYVDVTTAGIIIVSFNTAAYIAEIIRSGINGVSQGQLEAARSLGLSKMQAMKKIVIPQALYNSVPALMNELIVNIKDSSVLSVIGVTDLFYMSKLASSKYYWYVPAFLIAGAIYFILTTVLSKLFEYLIGKYQNKQTFPQSQTTPEVIK